MKKPASTQKIKKDTTVYDHLDNKYPTFAAMCDNYGIGPMTVKGRLKRGYDLESALMNPVTLPNQRTIDRLKSEREGLVKVMSNGQKATLVRYNSSEDCTVQFEDGTVREHIQWCAFNAGKVKNPYCGKRALEVIGTKQMQICGQEATVIKYQNIDNAVFRFEDGTEVSGRYETFLNGSLVNPNLDKKQQHRNFRNRLGEKKTQKCGLEAEITAYRGSEDIDILFSDGTTSKHRSYVEFKRGSLSSKKRRKYDEYIGERYLFPCGIWGTIKEFTKESRCIVEFDDGETTKTELFRVIEQQAAHPVLSSVKNSVYMGFETSRVFQKGVYRVNGTTFYKAKCQCCGFESILSPQDMLEHHRLHQLFEAGELQI